MLGIAAPASRAARLESQGARRRGRVDRRARARLGGLAAQQHRLDLFRCAAIRRPRSTYWQKALPLREAAGNSDDHPRSRSGRSRAGCARSGRLDDAQAIQLALVTETERANDPDGYVYEELAEIALARGDPQAAAIVGREGARAAQGRRHLKANEAARLDAPRGSCAGQVASESGEAARDLRATSRRRIRIRRPSSNTRSPFELLVAVVLSAQATDKGVNKATARLFPVANTPAAIAKLGVDGLIPYINSIGLFRDKAKNVVALSRDPAARARRQGPAAPRRRSRRCPAWAARPPTSCSTRAFGEPTIAVDTHIFRVANRTGLAPGKDVVEVERKLEKFTPDEFKRDAHHWLILHGRYTCVARTPKCPQCIDPRPVRVPAEDEGRRAAAALAQLARCSIPRATRRGGS